RGRIGGPGHAREPLRRRASARSRGRLTSIPSEPRLYFGEGWKWAHMGNTTTNTSPGTGLADQEQETYRFLEWRLDSWRKQPYLIGRRMTVANVVFGMRAYKLTPEEAAEDFDLPLEQIKEALLYYQ